MTEKQVLEALKGKRKVIVLLGPRQVGKTTLMERLAAELEGRVEILNGDFLDDRDRLKPDRVSLHALVDHIDYLFIDEAQNIPDIGQVLKLIHDQFAHVRVLATGSSSFDLTHRTGEPLTGRQTVFHLYPIAFSERQPRATTQDTLLTHAMIYGGYPECITTPEPENKIRYLKQLVSDYLFKDIYSQVDVNRTKMVDILRLLAFQIGSEVSFSEVASKVQLDVKTVAKYIGFLEETFILVRLGAFSRNLRKEVAKSQKFFFTDLGIRNALINAFNPPHQRDDMGKLWENLLIMERMKHNAYLARDAAYYFWRTYDRKEIDLIEETSHSLHAFEFKYSSTKKAALPKLWLETYPESTVEIITPAHAMRFLTE
ncbi:MAG: ATP-binding protein [Planctomycetota bacterium]